MSRTFDYNPSYSPLIFHILKKHRLAWLWIYHLHIFNFYFNCVSNLILKWEKLPIENFVIDHAGSEGCFLANSVANQNFLVAFKPLSATCEERLQVLSCN